VTRALVILIVIALVIVVGLSFVGGESADARRESVAPTNQPGYYLTGATITDTGDDGAARTRIRAERIEQRPADNSVVLSALQLTYSGADVRDWIVTAEHGVVPESSKVVRLAGNVQVRGAVGDGGLEAVIETPTLEFDTEQSIASTSDDVRIVMGTRALTAHGLDADLKQHRVRLESRVHGQFNPPFGR
jgi:LPS export ABC transporter protein LptC